MVRDAIGELGVGKWVGSEIGPGAGIESQLH